MPTHRSRPDVDPSAGHDDLLDLFVETMAPDPFAAPSLVGLLRPETPGPPVLTIIELAGDDPVVSLIGTDAPRDWVAVAFCGSGTGRPVSGLDASETHLGAGRVRIIHGLRRDGSWVCLVRTDAGQVLRSAGDDATTAAGHIDDVLRRMLGLPTRPPAVGALHLWAGIWLSIVVRALELADVRHPPSWPEVAALYPSRWFHTPRRAAVAPPGQPDDLVARGHAWAAAHGWESIRDDRLLWDGDDAPTFARHGSWLDAGAFSRFAMVGASPLGHRLDVVTAIACDRWGGDVAGRIRSGVEATLAGWGLDPDCDPAGW